MSRTCLVDQCGKPALAAQSLCLKHGVFTPQGMREDLRRACSDRLGIENRILDGKPVSPEDAAAAEFVVARMEAAVRAWWTVDSALTEPRVHETPTRAAA